MVDPADVAEPTLEQVLELDVEIGVPIDVGETGDGQRLIIPITGGSVSGRVDGTVLPVGADFQLSRTERPTAIEAKYAFETDDGATVYVENEGIVHAPPAVRERMLAGEDVDPEELYFRTTPTFETGDPDLSWLTEHVFVASATAGPGGVELVVYRVT